MHTDQDVTRLVRSWLRTDEHESATTIVIDVLARVDSIPQHRSSWPVRRNTQMNAYAKLAIAAAAVLVVAVVGISLLPNGARFSGGPAGSSTASPSQSIRPSPFVSGDAQPLEAFLQPGTRYAVPGNLVSFSFVVPSAGWTYDGAWFHGGIGTSEEIIMSFYTRSATMNAGVFTDPCAHTGLRQFARSIDGDAQEAASVPGLELVGGPSDTTVDGRAAMVVTKRVPADIGCSNTAFWLSHDPDCGVKIACTSYPTWLGEWMRSWIVGVGSSRLSITTEVHAPSPSSSSELQLQQIVDSIRFE
jgi:hypothetical protein